MEQMHVGGLGGGSVKYHHLSNMLQFMPNVDLHCHSYISDGMLAPAAVAARAKANGVEVWALTDHDEIGGIAEARQAAERFGLKFIAGVEISITWAGETVHIVGLGIDETHTGLLKGLSETRSGRERRGREIGEQLAAVGIPGAFEGALKYAGNPDLISRTHFARYIIERGACKDMGEVFRRFLVDGKPGYVPHRWATLKEAVNWIRDAGGVAVVAHPGRYSFSDVAFDAFFNEFKSCGGTAIEVVTGSHTPDQYDQFARVANGYGFLASRGSDVHAPGESEIDLGKLPPLPGSVVPVWHDWKI
jgi:hypothetical protein